MLVGCLMEMGAVFHQGRFSTVVEVGYLLMALLSMAASEAVDVQMAEKQEEEEATPAVLQATATAEEGDPSTLDRIRATLQAATITLVAMVKSVLFF